MAPFKFGIEKEEIFWLYWKLFAEILQKKLCSQKELIAYALSISRAKNQNFGDGKSKRR